MLLYEHPLSSYAQKVKIALREKGLDFQVETPAGQGLGTATGAFAAASPRKEVPVLMDGEARVFDSTIILEYLEDRYPSPPLLPRNPIARAEARMIEDVCDTLYEAVNWGVSEVRWYRRAEGDLAAAMMATAARQTAELQAWLTASLGERPWFSGEAFGWADVSVAPYLNRSFYNGLGTPPDSPLTRWLERARERPSVAATFAEAEAAAAGMASAAERMASGAVKREYRDHRLEWMMKSGGVQIVLDGLAKGNIRFTWPLG
ncbi:glutathione S-transferase family protein [Cupriavidus sp. L7L]|uniref:glutathione S-transferase family protein n=1 Tax=Cupriavidus sp. L7L TaxID=2546443 RepID=UPI0010564CAE|nr:glutathione S-transferase family protein [Cupriavidus sp. L7L]TDF64525.1 glutathione S-transferase family protein [Cupriavidus sp. L7L]